MMSAAGDCSAGPARPLLSARRAAVRGLVVGVCAAAAGAGRGRALRSKLALVSWGFLEGLHKFEGFTHVMC